MYFIFDDRRFNVAIAPRPLMKDGQACEAALDFDKGDIWLSDQLHGHKRKIKLFHELRHAWKFLRGEQVDEEDDADSVAEMMVMVMHQFDEQGGEPALMAMEPDRASRLPRVPATMMNHSNAPCGYCHAPVAVGSIGSTAPAWNEDMGCWTMDRGIFCTVCEKVTAWRETCTASGMPTGGYLAHPQPRVLPGPEASAWIAKHQQLCGVYMG